MNTEIFICQYCGKICKNKMSKVKHEYFCKLNPEYQNHLQKHKDTTVKASKSDEILKKQSEIAKIRRQKFLEENLDEQFKDFELTCKKCNCIFIRRLKIKHFKNNYRVPQYCCQEHANSHIHTNESKQKISKSVSKERLHKCPKCGKDFIHIGSAINTTWCDECFEKETGYSRKYLKANASHRSSTGNIKKLGNDIELHSSNCLGCNKIIWSKTSDDVYCYDCCESLHKRIHQLFDRFGHKVVSDKTKKKLSNLVQERIKNGTHKGWMSRNKTSYAENFFIKVLNSYSIKYDREVRTPEGYFLDFVITLDNGLKVDLEIDGKQHTYDDKIHHDKKRDIINRANGYLVYRIPWLNINKKLGKMRIKARIKQFLWWLNKMKEIEQ